MSFIEMVILSGFEAVMALLIIHGIYSQLKSGWIDKLVFVVGVPVLTGITEVVVGVMSLSHIISTLIMYAFVVAYLKRNSKVSMGTATVIFFAESIIILLIQLSSIVILQHALASFRYSFINGLYSQTLSIAMILAGVKFLPMKVLEKYCIENHIKFRVIISTFFMIHYVISILWTIDFSQLIESVLAILIIIILTTITSTMLVRESVLVSSYEEKIGFYETYLHIIDDLIEEFRESQHDYHNHIQTLISLNRAEDNEIKSYIGELVEKEVWKNLLVLDNKILIALFYSKHKKALDKNVKINFNIINSKFVSDYQIFDVVEMYGILIDNAIEASKSGDVIDIKIESDSKKNRFEIMNPFKFISSNDIQLFFTKHYTSKQSSKHGVGLYKLREKLLMQNDQIYFSYSSKISKVIVELEHH